MSVHTHYPYTKYKDESGAVVYEFITTNPQNDTLSCSCSYNGMLYNVEIKNISVRTRFYAKFDLEISDYTSEYLTPMSCPKYTKMSCMFDTNSNGIWIYSKPDTNSSGLQIAVITSYGDNQPSISTFFTKVVVDYMCDIYNGITGEVVKKDYVYFNWSDDLSDCNVLTYTFDGSLNYPGITTTLQINGLKLETENIDYPVNINNGDFK